jgi:hydrogenase/urease accessory protein HupE
MVSSNLRLLLAAAVVWMAPHFTGSVAAHPLAPALLEMVERTPGLAKVRWKTPLAAVPGAAMRPLLPAHCSDVGSQEERADGTALVRDWEIACSGPLSGSSVAVAGIGASRADVVLRVALADNRTFNTVLSAAQPAFIIPVRDQPFAISWSYFALGFEHILIGLDHLLFILALMLLVGSWRQLVATVTAFTVGHSVTLSLAALGFVRVPQDPVEVLIALSILIMAVELTRGRDAAPTLMRRFPWAVAFSFGLLHGLGFAGALAEVGLPAADIPLALLSFNLGIEVGQLAFCAVALMLYRELRHLQLPSPVRAPRLVAYTIGSLAAFWLFERATAI